MKQLYAWLFTGVSLLWVQCDSNDEKVNITDKPHLSTTLVHHNNEKHTGEQMPVIRFTDTVHNFGQIREGEKVSTEFVFVNEGHKDLIISQAEASCGCTVPVYPQFPIAPGEQHQITVTFNSEGKPGFNEKTIMIYSNTQPSIHQLYIQAEVIPK